jgi:hypothetical protein
MERVWKTWSVVDVLTTVWLFLPYHLPISKTISLTSGLAKFLQPRFQQLIFAQMIINVSASHDFGRFKPAAGKIMCYYLQFSTPLSIALTRLVLISAHLCQDHRTHAPCPVNHTYTCIDCIKLEEFEVYHNMV